MSDTTPINYLVVIGDVWVLPSLYDRVLIPSVVYEEILHPGTPQIVLDWAFELPVWCEVHTPTGKLESSLFPLDAGERDAIQLALEFGIGTLITDDRDARREAERRNLVVNGTLSLLEEASRRGLIHFRASLEKLQQTNFRLSQRLRDEFLRRNP